MRWIGALLLAGLCVADNLPTEHMNASSIIRYWGYPCEDHSVQTADGYILGVQRITAGRNKTPKPGKPAILLQHGLLGSSINWISLLPNQSLAFILADAGYDVWLGNARGNVYSRRHISLSPNDRKFWDFTWSEMASQDLPAMVEYILDATKLQQIYYAGHSQGTLMGFTGFENPDLAKKIKAFFALAPVYTVGHVNTELRLLAPFAPEIEAALDTFGDYASGDVTWILKYVRPFCHNSTGLLDACENLLFFFAGYENKSHINETMLPVQLAHNPAGTSIKNIVHYAQNVNHDNKWHSPRMYDYGLVGNLKRYHSTEPPMYNVGNMTTYAILFHSLKDNLADPIDVTTNLIPRLQNTKLYQYSDYSHLDFIWAIDAAITMYPKIVAEMRALDAQ